MKVFEILSSSEHTTPLEFLISTILFLQYRCVALLWKNLVFLSPSCNHRALNHCFHICSSLTNRPVSSFLTMFNQSVLPPLMATSSASFSCFLFSVSCLRTLPKADQLHHFNFVWHLNIFPSIRSIESPSTSPAQADSTTPWHPSSSIHIFSNLQGLWFFFGIPSGNITMGL